jgi:CheY-like chemotaxis protein
MTSSNPRSESTDGAETVLVVEDEVLIRMVISEYLCGCGYKVIEAANADEAILLQQQELTIDPLEDSVEPSVFRTR